MDKAGTALVADLRREYGFDLRELLSEDPPSPRYVLGLIEELPPNYKTSAILRDEIEGYGWDTTAYLLAAIANSVREGTFVNMQVRTKKKLQPIDPIKVPGLEKKKKEKQPANNFVRMAQAQLAKTMRS